MRLIGDLQYGNHVGEFTALINLHDIIFKPNYGLATSKNAAAGRLIGQKSATKEKMPPSFL